MCWLPNKAKTKLQTKKNIKEHEAKITTTTRTELRKVNFIMINEKKN